MFDMLKRTLRELSGAHDAELTALQNHNKELLAANQQLTQQLADAKVNLRYMEERHVALITVYETAEQARRNTPTSPVRGSAAFRMAAAAQEIEATRK